MNEREFTIDDLSSPYGQEDVSYFAYGGPVGESMQNEIQPAMQYFSEGGEVDDESPDEDEVEDIGEIPSRPVVPQEFSKGGLAKKAAEKLAEFLAESRVKERLYHATPKDITEFKPGGDNPKRSGPAIWMTPNNEFQPAAHNIRQVPDKPGYMYGSSSNMFTPGTNVMPLYANIKNPLIATDKNLPEVYEAFGGSPWVMSQEMVNKLKERGHDGLFYYRDGKLEEVVAFDPTQVKSAIGNRGTYNRQEPDIRKAKGGLVYRAQGSPIYGEIPDSGPITADTKAAFKAKGPSAASVVSESARMLRNITGEGVSNLESAVRGSVAAIPGTFGDIESIFRESDKTRKLATTEEVLRDYMPKRVTKPTKEAKGFEEVGSYLPLPVPAGTVSKAATTTGKGVEKGAAKMLERLGPRTGRSWEPLLAQAGAAPMYAVKTKGGAFYPEGMGSGVDTYLDRVVKGLTSAENLPGRDAKAVAEFIRTKGRKYLTSVYGTENDPLRLAVAEGRMPLYGSDSERFRDYLLDAARAGNPNAIKDLERFYDEATHLSTQGYVPAGSADPSYVVGNRMQAAQRERLLAEGVPEDLINPVYPSTSSAEQMATATYSPEARQKLGQLLQGMEELPPDMRESYVRGVGDTDKGVQSLLYSATKEQPIYDLATTPSMDFLKPNNLAEGIASIPLRDLERMTFPEAVVKGAQNMRLKRDRGLMLEKARDGKAVPKEIYFDGTQPVYEIDKNQKWVRIMSPDAVELEGAAMRHSIGGYKTSNSYNLGGRPAFESGLARIFSLRNEKGIPQVTVETKFTDEDGLMIKEVRSKFNSEPTAEEKRAVLQLFETLGPKDIRSTSYRNSRTGEALKEEDQVTVNWGDEFKNYMQYKNKGEE